MPSLHFPAKRTACLVAIAIGCMSGCSLPVHAPQSPTTNPAIPAAFPDAYYRQREALGKSVLHVDPNQSIVSIEVRRAGTLARLGHDHVVASRNLQGYVELEEGRADIYAPLAQLTVDEPALRAEVGFDTQPSPEAIDGTRNNMLTKVLETDRFPFVLIHATRIDPASPVLRVSLTLHGTTRIFEVPVAIEMRPNGICVSGRFALNQSDFGIVPFSILGGAIQVQDRLDLRFRIITNQR